MRQFIIAAAAAAFIGGMTAAIAQHNHSHSATPALPLRCPDTREFVKFPEPLVEHTLANIARSPAGASRKFRNILASGTWMSRPASPRPAGHVVAGPARCT